MHIGIAPGLPDTAAQAAALFRQQYDHWLQVGRFHAWGDYKRRYFCIAVGGGNTVKAQYRALLDLPASAVDWLQHARFFSLEESAGEASRESAIGALEEEFLYPLVQRLLKQHGARNIAKKIGCEPNSDPASLATAAVRHMCQPLDLQAADAALAAGNRTLALRLGRREALRYQRDLERKLGGDLAFHMLISGIGKDGTLGAFAPYTPELAVTEPGVCVLKPASGGLRIALNRGVLTGADCISLIVSGSHKLKALGRFEMEEEAEFEQTVMETPLRMLRCDRDTAERVYLFADEQALHFDETTFSYKENGELREHKAETREGEEADGIHVLLMHGFMGLFSFTSFLIRLPSAWTVSALHRGSHAKNLPAAEIFPHYALGLRKAILRNWRQGRPSPVVGHSIAGVIMDHLLLSLIGDRHQSIPPYSKLNKENRQLVDALRSSGLVHLATWAPCDGPNTGENIKNLVSHWRHGSDLDYSGFSKIYERSQQGLSVSEDIALDEAINLGGMMRFLSWPIAKPTISGFNLGLRKWLSRKSVQQRLLNSDSPYVMRIVGSRLLKKISFFGLCKEVTAALHEPTEYHRRHLKALDIVVAYDIPILSIVHQDDFLVSANRHREEHAYLVAQRQRKLGRSAGDTVNTRYIALQRETEELPVDPLNPHLMIMSTSTEGNRMAREITAAITAFVNDNVAKAVKVKRLKPLASVKLWLRKQGTKRSKARAA